MKRIIKKANDSAVVGIVTAMLIVSLIVTVISIFQLVYVPIIMEQREAEHMDRVAEQFGFLTSVIDDQAAVQNKGIPIATFVTLGSKELPFLISSKASGNLEILEKSSKITINNDTQTDIFPIGTITYSSTNSYFLNQFYTYETGAMIVSQSKGNLMMAQPGFYVDYNDTSDIVNIYFDVVNISGVEQKNNAAGSGVCGIQTEFLEVSMVKNFTNVSSITIDTPYTNAWFVFINYSLMKADLNSAGSETQFYLNETQGQFLNLDFSYSNYLKNVKINIKIIEIQAQVGPGWVE